jgi:hypothetical protein
MFCKFNEWFNFNRLKLGSADEWAEWDDNFRKKAPIRHWLTHRLPYLTWYPVKWKYDVARDWVRYRRKKYHIIDTGLTPGYYDKDTLLLHANFSLLKNFVEIEKASMHRWSHASTEKETLLGFIPKRKKIDPLNGIKYLEWETTLDVPDEDGNSNPEQAAHAREILELYTWWVFDRPNRVELESPEAPADDVEHTRSFMYRMSTAYREKYPEYHAAFSQWCVAHSKQEEDWAEEDTEMLIRLIKVRKSLWT